jgi:hypothetical protein
MIEDEHWLFRPVMRGMLQADKLLDGTVDLAFVMLCNEAIDVELENQRRVTSAIRNEAKKPGNRR